MDKLNNNKIGIVYLIKNKINKKVWIGQTWNLSNRISRHKSNTKYNKFGSHPFYDSIRHYGIKNFTFPPKILCEVHTQEELDKWENYFIEHYYESYKRENGYNIKLGGNNSNGLHTEKSKQKMSKNRKGLTNGKKNPMYGINMIDRLINKYGKIKGYKKYQEWRNNISLSTKGKNNPRYINFTKKEKDFIIKEINLNKSSGIISKLFNKTFTKQISYGPIKRIILELTKN